VHFAIDGGFQFSGEAADCGYASEFAAVSLFYSFDLKGLSHALARGPFARKLKVRFRLEDDLLRPGVRRIQARAQAHAAQFQQRVVRPDSSLRSE